MADEIDLELEEQNEPNKTEQRIKDLSGKVRTYATERDEALTAKQTAEAERAEAQKDVEFYKGFSTVASKYQGAAEYQEQIREKVRGGYELEDAAISILAREGKYNAPATPQAAPDSPAGGSAANRMPNMADKPISEMSREEKRAALIQAEAEGGYLSKIFRAG